MSYDKFKKKAAEMGLTDLTREEYDNIVLARPGVSTPAVIRFVKAARKGVVGAGERSQANAYALGAKDHMYPGMTIEKAGSQKITFLFEDGRMADYMWKGNWNGIHGRLHEVEVEEGERPKRDSDEKYAFRDLKVATVQEAKFDLSMLPLTDMTRVDEDDLYTSVAFQGMATGVWAETIWENRKAAGEYDFNQGDYPTCSVSFKFGDVFVSAHFGPYNRAVPLIRVEDWDLNVAKTLDDLTGYMYEADVVVIGTINSIKEKRDEDTGEETTNIHIAATAMFYVTDEELQEPVREKSSGKAKSKTVTDPVKKQTKAKKLVEAVMKGIKVIGPDCTVEELKAGGYIDEDEDDKLANMTFKIAMKKYEAAQEQADDDEDDDDGEKPDEDDAPQAVQVSKVDAAGEEEEDGAEEEDESGDESGDEKAGEEEDEEPDPDGLLETAILDYLEEMGPREVKDLKTHFRKKKFANRVTKVSHVTTALEVLEAEEEITVDDGLAEILS